MLTLLSRVSKSCLLGFCTLLVMGKVLAVPSSEPMHTLYMQNQPGFFRFSFDNIRMPQQIDNMGLLGINYNLDITQTWYAGIGGYGSVTGTQGGLFVLTVGTGLHHELFDHWWGDIGLDAGGGGGRSSLVGGGLMWRPHIGIEYAFTKARLGIHYSYFDFPSGQVKSNSIGLDLDLPFDFYYVPAVWLNDTSNFKLSEIALPTQTGFLGFQRNDFALLLQSYWQKTGTLNVNHVVQDENIGLIGAELDHYLTKQLFWWVKAAGAFSGSVNGYMDVLGGLGYHQPLGTYGIALVPQLGIGAGGGGNVDTGGGILIQPQLGLELPLSSSFSARLSGGYLWAPKGNLSAITGTGELIYHLNVATVTPTPLASTFIYDVQGWRVYLFNQTYFHPQRTFSEDSAINLLGVQIDQLFTSHFFFSYQATSAYSGTHAGGLAAGMIGPGVQSAPFFKQRWQGFAECLVGAVGGGSLAVGGGATVEPEAGVRYALSPGIGIQASMSQVIAVNHDLSTPTLNLGVYFNFGTLNQV